MSPPTRRQPHFFKVLVRDFKKRLRIPSKFMKHIPKEPSQRVTLEGPNGSSWQADLSETTEGNFFSDGWSDFVKDHSLKEHEFLVFRYNGNMHFSVIIFDTSACERDDLFELKTPENSSCNEKKKRGRPPKRSLDDDCTLQHKSSRTDSLDILSDSESAPKKVHGQHGSSNPTSNANIKPVDADLPIRTTRRKTSYLSRRPVIAEERSKAHEAAYAFRSEFPYTILRMTKVFVYERFLLRFHRSFSQKHLPLEKTNMVLSDLSGKRWSVVYIPSPRTGHLSGGWVMFARDNKLEEGDFCAFELIRDLELRVHIFRVVK